MKKRFLSVLLAAILLLSLLVMSAFAESPCSVIDGTAKDAHGSISFNKTSAAKDEMIEITVKADEYYQLKSLEAKYFDGEKDQTCVIMRVKGITFAMPDYDVTVTAEFELDPAHTHSPVKVDGQAANEDLAGWKDHYRCACGTCFEDLAGKNEIADIEAWKAKGGKGYIPAELIVTDSEGEAVEPGAETYEIKADGIHVYSDDIFFSGKTKRSFIPESDWRDLNLKNLTIEGDLIFDGCDDVISMNMTNAVITGDVIARNSTDELYLYAVLDGENKIGGEVISDGSFTVFGKADATLTVKRIKTEDMIYLSDLRMENVKEDYVIYESTSLTPKDETKPILFIIKKDAVFPDAEDYAINGGEPFVFGEPLKIEPPIVMDENGKALNPQPKLTILFFEYDDSDGYRFSMLESAPTEEGSYMAAFYMPEEDPYYCGFESYDFAIGHGLEKVPAKDPTETAPGHKAYYLCKGCGKCFEDAKGSKEITDIEAWKAKGGEGYIAPLGKKVSPKTGVMDNGTLLILILGLSSAGIGAGLACRRKKEA